MVTQKHTSKSKLLLVYASLTLAMVSPVFGGVTFYFASSTFLPNIVEHEISNVKYAPTWVSAAPEMSPWLQANMWRYASPFSQFPVLVVPPTWKDTYGLTKVFGIYKVNAADLNGLSLLLLSGGRVMDLSHRQFIVVYTEADGKLLIDWVKTLITGSEVMIPMTIPPSPPTSVSVSVFPDSGHPDGRDIQPGYLQIEGGSGVFPLAPVSP